MKPVILSYLFFTCFSFAGFKTFAIGPGDYAPVIKKQAQDMNNALIAKDYKTYAKYIYPTVIQHMGGEKGFIDTMKQVDVQMKREGAVITYISLGEASWVEDTAKELQATIKETIEVKVKSGSIQQDVVFVAVSKDGGKNWTFIDTTTDYEAIHKQFPTLSSRLVIPKPSQPVFEAD